MNTRSLLPKIDELELRLGTSPFGFIGITETWLNNNISDSLLSINGYNIYRKDREHGRGGGVCAFVAHDTPAQRKYDLEKPDFECIWIWLRPHRLPRPLSGIICCAVYNPPDSTTQQQKDLVEYLIAGLDTITAKHPDCGIVIMGDFNGLDVNDILANHNLRQIVNESTRGNNILDLIITNLDNKYKPPEITAPLGSSDHNTIEWRPNTTNNNGKIPTTHSYVRRFPQSSIDAFGRWVSNHSWFSDIENLTCATALTSSFTNELKTAINNFFPLKRIQKHCDDKPWMTTSLKQLINKRQKAFHSGNEELWRHYKNKVRHEISIRKRTYYSDKVKHLKTCEPKKWWDYIKKISGNTKSTHSTRITKNGEELTDADAADALNTHFTNVSDDLPHLDTTLLPAFLPTTATPPVITPQQVCKKLLQINPSKSHGPDEIPNRLLKEFAYELANPVCTIFNTSLSTGEFPQTWKDAIITPVPKSKQPTSVDEFRPIALTSTLSKVLEDFVVEWMINDIKHNIDPQQFGSLKGSSTSLCLIDMLNNWLKSLDTPSHYLRVCFIDFSKAFDRINHNILVNKLLSLGLRPCLVPWICNFLLHRRQCVRVQKSLSDWTVVNGGLPQGTKLGPILFLVMINDLQFKQPNISHWKYVDDVTISECLHKDEPSRLQQAITKLQQWTNSNDMKINGKKCKELTVSFLRKDHQLSPISIDGHTIDNVDSFKVLGVNISNDLKWTINTEQIITKASQRLYILRVLRRSGIPPSDLLPIYYSLVRSTLEYACVAWHTSLPDYLRNKIELIQKRALRIIYPHLHYDEATAQAKCVRLDERRDQLCQKTFVKLLEMNSRLHHLIPESRGTVHKLNLRNNNNFTLPKCRTKRYKTSFIPAMCSVMNSRQKNETIDIIHCK